ncbi:MAG: type II toxin-antitoxin system Phd/YefM family antitoxin [Actinobacteria bacterium]|nr:type II toxin-antitoxin system Phd/YefM family antitoxin [Actinomycetota bacterium]
MNKFDKDNTEYSFKDTESVSVAEAKSNFSEYIAKAAYMDEKIIITKRGRPVAAIISIEDLKKLKLNKQNKGLEDAIGKWVNFDDIEKIVKKIYRNRKNQEERDVSF